MNIAQGFTVFAWAVALTVLWIVLRKGDYIE